MAAEIELTVNIPERDPYEGNATMKQKNYLWQLGYRDQNVIDRLGKNQAGFVIDAILKTQRNATGLERKAKSGQKFGVGMLLVALFFGSSMPTWVTVALVLLGSILLFKLRFRTRRFVGK